MESKCHVGVTCSFDSVEKLGWRVDIRSHRIQEVIDKILNVWETLFGDFPHCYSDEDEEECVDCGLWEYVEGI